jgi:cyclase
MQPNRPRTQELEERPEAYLGPDLNPDGLQLQPEKLADGVYALMANIPPKDNNGVIVGERAALVVDAGVNGAISHQIQAIARQLTDKPLLYLVNTTYHGDHTFGNYAFPSTVTIISSKLNKESMRDLAYEKRMRAGNLRGNLKAIADVQTWRRPDILFDRFCAVDLGDQVVELWCFGPGNAPGDTIVYVPSAKVAWTGNFLMRAGIAPMLLEGGPAPYIQTLHAMQATLDVATIVPGHGPMGDAAPAIDSLLNYLEELQAKVQTGIDRGQSVDEILSAYDVPRSLTLPPQIVAASTINPLNHHLHRLNVLATYRDLEGQSRAATRPNQ